MDSPKPRPLKRARRRRGKSVRQNAGIKKPPMQVHRGLCFIVIANQGAARLTRAYAS